MTFFVVAQNIHKQSITHKEDKRCIPRCQLEILMHCRKIRSSVPSIWKSVSGRLEVEVQGVGAGLRWGGWWGRRWRRSLSEQPGLQRSLRQAGAPVQGGAGEGDTSVNLSVHPTLKILHSGLPELWAPFQSWRIEKAGDLPYPNSLEHSIHSNQLQNLQRANILTSLLVAKIPLIGEKKLPCHKY